LSPLWPGVYVPGSIRRTRATSAFAADVDERNRRFRFLFFLVSMCDLQARIRLSFPVPVLRKRFAAPRFDFIFGMGSPWDSVV
jgi:hypothetical protein